MAVDTLVAVVPVISAVAATRVEAGTVAVAADTRVEAEVGTVAAATAIDKHQSPRVTNLRAFFFLIYSISIR